MKLFSRSAIVLSLVLAVMAVSLMPTPAEAVRTVLTPVTPLGPYPSLPVAASGLDLAWTAADTSNFNAFTLQGPTLILVRNVHATNAFTFTLTSVADQKGRTGDITTYSLAAGKVAAFYIGQTEGWLQSDGRFYLTGADTNIQFCIVRIPQ